jgi:Gpi18-like mannosyltransferase
VPRALIAFVGIRITVLFTLIGVCQFEGKSVFSIFNRWDSQWYRRIATNGYGFTVIQTDGRHLSDYAFFPLFPLLERAVSKVTTLAIVDSGILISAIASGFAAIGIFKIVDHIYGSRMAFYATTLWALIPVGVVEWLSYSESLFTALAAWSLYFLLKKNWLTAAILAVLAGLTRPIGIAVAISVMAGTLWPTEKSKLDWRRIVAFIIAPLGWLGYLTWVGLKLHNAFGYFAITKQWHNSFDWGRSFLKWIIHLLNGVNIFAGIIIILALFLLCLLYWRSIKIQQPMPLLIYCGIIIALALSTSGYFGSKPRYLLPAFPLLLPIAKYLSERSRKVTNLILVVLTVIASTYGAIWLTGSGPL